MPKGDFLGAPAECFRAKFFIKLETKEAAYNWITDFQQTTRATYRILKGCKTTGSLIRFKTVRHCGIITSTHYCPSRLTLCVFCNRLRNLQKFPVHAHLCEVEITTIQLNAIHSLSFCDVLEETKAKFYKYFACGHSAASARHQHKFHLQLSADAALVEKLLADRAMFKMFPIYFK